MSNALSLKYEPSSEPWAQVDGNWTKHEAKIVEVDKRGLDTQKRIGHLEEAFRKADIEGLTRKVVLASLHTAPARPTPFPRPGVRPE